MRLLIRNLGLVMMLSVFSTSLAASRCVDLDTWIETVLTPYVSEKLATHPRFAGESLRFVVMENGNPQATTNSLALHIRNRLRETAGDVPGIRIAWQPDNPHFLRGPEHVDCTRGEAHYLIGIELTLTQTEGLMAELHAFDTEDRSLVAGFTKSWRGSISSRQYRQFRNTEVDQTFRGEREAPYQKSQADLLAAHLAHDLGCKLLRQTEAEYVLLEGENEDRDSSVANIIELVSNNLMEYRALQFSPDNEYANSVIEGKAHQIDNDLYHYWVTLQPLDAELPSLSASAYVRLPEKFSVAEVVPYVANPPMQSDTDIIESLSIVELRTRDACRSFAKCHALQISSSDDAIVFFLNYQLDDGLVRLSDLSCVDRSNVRVVTTDEPRQFPLPPNLLTSALWSATDAWQLEPNLDTYYAIAAADAKAARALSQHIARLPERCSVIPRPGLEGTSLRLWTRGLVSIIKRWEPVIDWQTVQVTNVY